MKPAEQDTRPPRRRIARGLFFLQLAVVTLFACELLSPQATRAVETPIPDPTPTLPSERDEVESTQAATNVCTTWMLLQEKDGWHLEKDENDEWPSVQESVSIEGILPDNRIPLDVDVLRVGLDLHGTQLRLGGGDDAHLFLTTPGDVDWMTGRIVDETVNGIDGPITIDIPLENVRGVGNILGDDLVPGDEVGETLGIRLWSEDDILVDVFTAYFLNSADPDCIAAFGQPDYVIED